MWCKNCKIETLDKKCPVCGSTTIEDIPTEIYYCRHCQTPVIKYVNDSQKEDCPLCHKKLKYMATDLRPVFPEERRLLELLLKKDIYSLQTSAIWANKNRYYIDGKSTVISREIYAATNTKEIRIALQESDIGKYREAFQCQMDLFVEANREHLFSIIEEAHEFIRKEASRYPQENIVLSFSGGKDSTVVADIVTKALSNPSLVHIFGNTTLEFPMTLDYAKRFREEHPQAIFQIAENREQNFMDMCAEIGPPARMMRWCCSMFKTGPITRIISNLYRNQQILTFYGIRKYESVSRSKYNRVEQNTESVKIQQQTVAAPIFNWKDIDVWLYILSEKIDFNDAYRLGYDRVGCYCCPNNNSRAQFLSSIYMPDKSTEWRDFLIDFAKKIGKADAEVYVDTGKWKARQGGNGLAAAKTVKLQFTNCTAEEYSKIYKLFRPYDDELINMFTPFGKVARDLGQKLLQETIILDVKSNVPILSLQPFVQDGYEYAVKVKTLNVKDHEELQRLVGYQIRKFNACRRCLKCESLCRTGAISIIGNSYYIDPDKCVHCYKCMNAKYLAGGCMMDKYLRTK
ncbi:phosphoadenosine phosphosulfate reductase domain-containing protein [Selenomonas ruminis]|uniref:Phosphoadenosine phosphosulfate reductase family protein n=1 Tax=Selenomonas ruminis TaxID=2593411 RepID=A0A5D6WCG3_9FIRM|nr:phosphoadenosine phosphosulfate reductase family protein [Selenomonas sp. mPRGC5]TYZ24655.1 phosphoadenosine phosphosulfate reductase family protein [Selenomonas sp. mPRGC5]